VGFSHGSQYLEVDISDPEVGFHRNVIFGRLRLKPFEFLRRTVLFFKDER
jgi:hypothetical protein